jgi:hypothetical protein
MADRLVVRTERRQRPIRIGGVLISAGLLLLLLGAITTWVVGIGQAAFAYDRAAVGDTLRFDGKAGDYSLLLINTPLTPFIGNPEAQIDCAGERPDGTTFEVNGAVALVRTETEAGIEIGRFSTTEGTTTVTCSRTSGIDSAHFYSVAPVKSWLSIVTTAMMIGGVVIILVGTSLIIYGVRGRAVTSREPG